VGVAKLGRIHRTFFAKTLSKANSSTSNVEGASSSLSSRFLLKVAQSLFEVASASLAGFTNLGKALDFETLPKVRIVDCLLPEDILKGWRTPLFGHDFGRCNRLVKEEGASKNSASDSDPKAFTNKFERQKSQLSVFNDFGAGLGPRRVNSFNPFSAFHATQLR
jgi:hypothetical protein